MTERIPAKEVARFLRYEGDTGLLYWLPRRDSWGRLNNRWSNIRPATPSENKCNRRPVKGACPYRGVYFVKRLARYGAQIKKNGEWRWLGLHETPEAAARAYDSAALQLHGKFAITNESLGLLEVNNGGS